MSHSDASQTDRLAQKVWSYMLMHQPLVQSDVIIALGSTDTRVAEHAARLWLQGYGRWLLCAGGRGRFTSSTFDRSEAEVFCEVAQKLGVPKDRILLESSSTNTGQNVQLSYEVLQEHGLRPQSILVVTKPYMERRAYATFKKQWPDGHTSVTVTSPPLSFEEYCDEQHSREHVIKTMLGDLERIRDYPAKGFMIKQPIPDNVVEAARVMAEQPAGRG